MDDIRLVLADETSEWCDEGGIRQTSSETVACGRFDHPDSGYVRISVDRGQPDFVPLGHLVREPPPHDGTLAIGDEQDAQSHCLSRKTGIGSCE
jgi:hypothetical protein